MACESLLIGNEIERRRIIIESILYIQINDYLSTFYLANKQKLTSSSRKEKLRPLSVEAEAENLHRINSKLHSFVI